jgi:two-component system chemotaxis sensor kinase CheA
LWRAFLRRCEELGWNAATAGVHLEPAELDELVAAVKSGERGPRLLEIVGSWSREPARTRLARLGEQVTSLAKRLGKPSPLIEIAPTKLRLPTKKWAPLLTSLAHVVRNVVDHGLESEDERRAAGKPMPPRVRFSLHADAKGAVVLSIADDGRGIAWEKIRERARALGLPHETQADLEEALYADRVSSMQEATETSGRGVGMGAVRAAVQACGGTLHVASAPGVGTTFRFVLPAFMLLDDERSHDERNSVPPRSGKQSLRWAAEVSS